VKAFFSSDVHNEPELKYPISKQHFSLQIESREIQDLAYRNMLDGGES